MKLCDPALCGRSATPECDGSCEANSAIRETPDLVRVYRPEWVVEFASDAVGAAGISECEEYFAANCKGRVREKDFKITKVPTPAGVVGRHRLELRLPVMKGEFKTATLANDWISEQPWATESGVVTVVRNSKADHDLRAYGTRMLPTS